MRKPGIEIVGVTNSGQYEAGNGKIERIGDKRGKRVSWTIRNETPTPIHVKIHNFPPDTCPVDKIDFVGCEYDSEANRHQPIPAGGTRTIKGLLARNRSGVFTYEFYVRNHTTGAGNSVDPELQIDDLNTLDQLKPALVTLGLIGAIAYVYRWFKS